MAPPAGLRPGSFACWQKKTGRQHNIDDMILDIMTTLPEEMMMQAIMRMYDRAANGDFAAMVRMLLVLNVGAAVLLSGGYVMLDRAMMMV